MEVRAHRAQGTGGGTDDGQPGLQSHMLLVRCKYPITWEEQREPSFQKDRRSYLPSAAGSRAYSHKPSWQDDVWPLVCAFIDLFLPPSGEAAPATDFFKMKNTPSTGLPSATGHPKEDSNPPERLHRRAGQHGARAGSRSGG